MVKKMNITDPDTKLCHEIKTPSLNHTKSSDWMSVYEPAEDTFLILDTLEKDWNFIASRKPKICLEVGSGSGVAITAISKQVRSLAHCLAIDINPIACALTRSTAYHNSASVDVLQGDLMNSLRQQSIDMIVFNPPYVATPSDELKAGDFLTKSWAGGIDGREVIDRFLNLLSDCLDNRGFGYILLLKENNPQDVVEILELKKFQCEVISFRKLRGEELCVIRFIKI